MSSSEKIFLTIPGLILLVIVSDALYAKPAIDMFYNECHYSVSDWVCQFSWTAFTKAACNAGLAYIGVVFLGSSDNLRNPQGESIGNDC